MGEDQQRQPTDQEVKEIERYLNEKHVERFGVFPEPYRGDRKGEASSIRSMLKHEGTEVTKTFIDECIKYYRPSPEYPTVNFKFMFLFMRRPFGLKNARKKVEKQQREAS
ncbi:hypothetical protein [Halobacillus halophilus]|uniref:hypothetical protein n=1 Tax=Halobacillus halophilus TaxID=1570 RepID=UPI00068530D1|nr:hypothetical protein [Halobacillus halophilus]